MVMLYGSFSTFYVRSKKGLKDCIEELRKKYLMENYKLFGEICKVHLCSSVENFKN